MTDRRKRGAMLLLGFGFAFLLMTGQNYLGEPAPFVFTWGIGGFAFLAGWVVFHVRIVEEVSRD